MATVRCAGSCRAGDPGHCRDAASRDALVASTTVRSAVDDTCTPKYLVRNPINRQPGPTTWRSAATSWRSSVPGAYTADSGAGSSVAKAV